MKTLPLAAAAALLLLSSAPLPAAAQEEGEEAAGTDQTAPGLSSRYVDCLRPRTVGVLLASPATRWGLSEELGKTAYDRIYGIQLCRGYVEDTAHHCRQFADVPGRQDRTAVTKELGRDCATDVEFFRAHAALFAKDRASTDLRCSRWCELEAGRVPGKLDCDAFCKRVIPLMPERAEEACTLWADRTVRLAKDPIYRQYVRPLCLMLLAPSPANCTDTMGPNFQSRCRERHAVLEAMRAKDAKRCPKALRYGAVCAALAEPGLDQAAACLKAARAFTEPFCAERRKTGGLQDETKLPGDSEPYLSW